MKLLKMIDKYLGRHNDTFNLKTVLLKTFKMEDKIYTDYEKLNISADFNLFISKYKITPDPYVHINTYYNFCEQIYWNIITSPPRYELFYRSIYANFTEIRISMVLVLSGGKEYYTVIKNFIHPVKITVPGEKNYIQELENSNWTFEAALQTFYEYN